MGCKNETIVGGHYRSCLIFIVAAGLVEPHPEQNSELVSLERETFSILRYHLTLPSVPNL